MHYTQEQSSQPRWKQNYIADKEAQLLLQHKN